GFGAHDARCRVARRTPVEPDRLTRARDQVASITPRNSAVIAESELTAPQSARPDFDRAIVCRNAATPERMATTTFTISVRPYGVSKVGSMAMTFQIPVAM